MLQVILCFNAAGYTLFDAAGYTLFNAAGYTLFNAADYTLFNAADYTLFMTVIHNSVLLASKIIPRLHAKANPFYL